MLLTLPISTQAATINLSTLPPVTNSNGVKYAELLGYRFQTPSYGALISTPDGLWNGNAFGTTTPVTISRTDGGVFSLDSFFITTHVAYACGGGFCGVDAIQVDVLRSDGVSVFEQFFDSGYAGETLAFTPTNPLFNSLKSATIYAADSFIINSISLGAAPVPLPGRYGYLLVG